ncbi:arylesterase [Ferrigenium sp. UT5]|uniref:arylesterase n=1 Tax=Ferrigenium sp. UT5 TaxID=3242105 RepID=UPI00354F8BB5
MKTFLKLVFLLAALATGGSAQAARTLLVFGDSLSAGYGIARTDSWVNLLRLELKKSHPQFDVVNASISGETTAGGLRRIGAALQQHQPTIVILALGANDGLRGTPLALTEQNLDRIIEQSRAAQAGVLLLGMRLPPNYGADYTARFQALYPKLARKHKLPILPFMLEGIAAEQFLPDNLHPNAAAQPIIMQNVMQHLKPLLNR